jgi:sugar lactone lactonase YvrE
MHSNQLREVAVTQKRTLVIGAAFLTLLLASALGQALLTRVAAAQGGTAGQVPMFQVDPLWPKPLPNGWVQGSTIGVAVDSRDHIWMIHRPSTLSAGELGMTGKPPALCCRAAPPVMEFDQEGNLVSSWGGPGPGYDWVTTEHGIYVDHKDNVWVGSNGRKDGQILKFTRQGKFLLQIGHPNITPSSSSTTDLGAPANIEVDPATNEVIVADGYSNHRVIVFDADTGAYKRMWGAYGNKPEDICGPDCDPPLDRKVAPKQFHNPVHCANVSKDGFIYVCDRAVNRIQVFRKDGTFVKEGFIERETPPSAWDLAFSADPQQRYLYLADSSNSRVHILVRDTLQVVGHFGRGGRYPGAFYGVHSIASDSRGNIYTGETFEGKRLQRFLYKGK